MKLQEIYNYAAGRQVILVFEGSTIVVTDMMFDKNSSDYRRSKVRLDVDFVFYGNMYDGNIMKAKQQDMDADALLFRTYRRSTTVSNYVVFINREYVPIAHIVHKCNYKRIIKKTDELDKAVEVTENAQVAEDTPINTDVAVVSKPVNRIMHVVPHVDVRKRQYYYDVKYNDDGVDIAIESTHRDIIGGRVPSGYYYAVISALDTAIKYKDKFSKVVIALAERESYWSQGVYLFTVNYWEPNSQFFIDYVRLFRERMNVLAQDGISVVFAGSTLPKGTYAQLVKQQMPIK